MTVKPALRNVMTWDEVQAMRRAERFKGTPKGKTRLEQTVADTKQATVDDQSFRADVFKLDKGQCRCCGRKVQRTLGRVPKRAEVHHVHGRRGALRYEVRAALLLCLTCHERCTGKVADKLVIVASVTFTLTMKSGVETFTNTRHPVSFRKVA